MQLYTMYDIAEDRHREAIAAADRYRRTHERHADRRSRPRGRQALGLWLVRIGMRFIGSAATPASLSRFAAGSGLPR